MDSSFFKAKRLNYNGFNFSIKEVESINSTNDFLVDRARKGLLKNLEVIRANYQTKGKGRKGRTWIAPKDSALLCSLGIKPTGFPVNKIYLLNFLLAIGLKEAVFELAGVNLAIKWPNDLIYVSDVGHEKKIGGILGEFDLEKNNSATLSWAVLGIGFNLFFKEKYLKDPLFLEIKDRVIYLNQITDVNVGIEDIFERLLFSLSKYLVNLEGEEGLGDLGVLYEKNLYSLGKEVRVMVNKNKEITGRAVAIDSEGHLVVRDNKGYYIPLAEGDVEHFRHN